MPFFPLVIPFFFFNPLLLFSCYLHRRCFSLSFFFFLPHLSSFFFLTLFHYVHITSSFFFFLFVCLLCLFLQISEEWTAVRC